MYPKLHILVIEEDELLGQCICYGLSHYNHDYDVSLAKESLGVWSFLQAEQFDLIILDLDLPGNSGEKILKDMRSKNITIPVIVMDRYHNAYGRTKILNIGADDCISKPFDLDELCERANTMYMSIQIKVI